MAVDMFLKISGGVKGESQDSKYKDHIDVLAWSWGLSQSGSAHYGGGSGSGKANFNDLSITKWVDTSTSSLMRLCATGEHIEKIDFIARKAGGKEALEYITINLSDCIITSLSTGGSGGEDRLTENITINFSKIEYTYNAQEKKGGSGGSAPFKYDIEKNKNL